MAKKREGSGSKVRTIRRVVQALSLFLFFFLIVKTVDPGTEEGILTTPVDLFPRLSPFLVLTSILASRQWILHVMPAVIVLVATVVLGRVFCGWVCPLGTTIDITDWLAKERRAKRSWSPEKERSFHNVKHIILIVSIVASLLGVQVAGWFDPLSLVTRTYVMVIHPFIHYFANNALNFLLNKGWLYSVVGALDDYVRRHNILLLEQPIFRMQVLFLSIFFGIAALGILSRRFWCRHLCPLGATLDLCSRFSLLNRAVDTDGCTHCLKCERECKMRAIFDKGVGTQEGECIECFACTDVCPVDVTPVNFSARGRSQRAHQVDLTRRSLLASLFGGVVAVPALRINYQWKHGYLTLVRPPGAGEEVEFLEKCIRCGQCMKVCLTNGLHPTLLEAGLEAMWTPRLVSRLGYCDYHCTLCGQACPTGAIKELPLPEKQKVVIGTAFFDKNRCIPWTEHRNCTVCEEHCPTPQKSILTHETKVIDTRTGEERIVKLPYVQHDRCIGCGICENKCPLPGQSAIIVARPQGVIDVSKFLPPGSPSAVSSEEAVM